MCGGVEDIWEVGVQWKFCVNMLTIPQVEASAAGEWELGRQSRRGIAGLHPRSSRHLACPPSPSVLQILRPSCSYYVSGRILTPPPLRLQTNLAALLELLPKWTNTDTSTASSAETH